MMNLVYLVPLLPLIGFLINGLGRKHLSKSMTGIIGSGVILGSFIISVLLFLQVKAGHTAIVNYFETIPSIHRSAILIGGIMFFWLVESSWPLFSFKYNKWRHAGVNFLYLHADRRST